MKRVLSHIVLFLVVAVSSFCSYAGNGSSLPFKGEILPGYEEDEVKRRCDASGLQPIEGIWYYPDEMMTVVVERCDDLLNEYGEDFRIVLVSANDMSLLPGTVIGFCSQTADVNKYKMWIYCEQRGSLLENPQMCIAVLNKDNNELLIERSEVKIRVRVNFSRFLPKLLKGISVVPNKKDVEIPEGFRKVYPEAVNPSVRVRYL